MASLANQALVLACQRLLKQVGPMVDLLTKLAQAFLIQTLQAGHQHRGDAP
jgi:hypothetical protein